MNSHQKQPTNLESPLRRIYLGVAVFWILFAVVRILFLAPDRSALPTIVGCTVALAANALLIVFLTRIKGGEQP
jgi:hypothetical protein